MPNLWRGSAKVSLGNVREGKGSKREDFFGAVEILYFCAVVFPFQTALQIHSKLLMRLDSQIVIPSVWGLGRD